MAIITEAEIGDKSCMGKMKALNLPVHVSRVKALLRQTSTIAWTKAESSTILTFSNEYDRIKWPKKHVKWKLEDWENVIFSDEKLFILDGPD